MILREILFEMFKGELNFIRKYQTESLLKRGGYFMTRFESDLLKEILTILE